jgi:hypothetical protein
MNNLTSVLNANLNNVNIDEFTKQGGLIEMTSGNVQRIAAMTMPAFTIKLNYKNLNTDDWLALRDVYEKNHSNTFIYESTEARDPRHEFIGDNASVWAFKDWQFQTDARTRRFTGFVELISSLHFNYPAYAALGEQTSSYNFTESADYTFNDLLSYISPYSVKYRYTGNSLVSSIMRSSSNIKDRGGLRKVWTLNWLVDEADFLELIQFYRKRGGVFNEFGMTDGGYTFSVESLYVDDGYVDSNYVLHTKSSGLFNQYLENHLDYVADDYLENDFFYNLNATFSHDGFKYNKRVDGFYTVEADILEAR